MLEVETAIGFNFLRTNIDGEDVGEEGKSKFHLRYLVWTFQDFSVTKILREIKFGESRSCKTGIFAILGSMNSLELRN